MIDKLLLLALVIMLPVGILVSRYLNNEEGVSGKVVSEEKVERLDKLLNDLKNQVSQEGDKEEIEGDKKEKFTITSVKYATESGVIKVMGTAPHKDYAVLVSAVILAEDGGEGNLAMSNKEALGVEVHNRAVKPSPGKGFVTHIPVTLGSGILEVRLDQLDVSYTLRYDLMRKKEI